MRVSQPHTGDCNSPNSTVLLLAKKIGIRIEKNHQCRQCLGNPRRLLKKTLILKLNGGLGTGMGQPGHFCGNGCGWPVCPKHLDPRHETKHPEHRKTSIWREIIRKPLYKVTFYQNQIVCWLPFVFCVQPHCSFKNRAVFLLLLRLKFLDHSWHSCRHLYF